MSNIAKTLAQYEVQLQRCQQIFEKKTHDYGTAWRALRPSSLTDQLFIKAKRIRSIEEKGEQRIEESIENEYIALVNYSVMALIQMDLTEADGWELAPLRVMELYGQHATATQNLMVAKNHDYGEAWRDMRISSLTDLILMKILRIKQIEDNQGKTLISEGIDANYQDIINYSLFALIKLSESAIHQ